MTITPVLDVRQVSKKFGKKKVLQQISLQVSRGEVFGFLGPNGAGKTTLIRIILGLVRPDGGEIYIKGYPVRGAFTCAIARVGAVGTLNGQVYPLTMFGMLGSLCFCLLPCCSVMPWEHCFLAGRRIYAQRYRFYRRRRGSYNFSFLHNGSIATVCFLPAGSVSCRADKQQCGSGGCCRRHFYI